MFLFFIAFFIHCSNSFKNPSNSMKFNKLHNNCILTTEMFRNGYTHPPSEYCTGPLEQTSALRNFIKQSHCGSGLFPHFIKHLNEIQCLQCLPGTSFAKDGSCSVNQYCSDIGRCTSLNMHPFLGSPCSYFPHNQTSNGSCGPGLTCYNQICSICLNGSKKSSLGIKCDQNNWIINKNTDYQNNTFMSKTMILKSSAIEVFTLIFLILLLLFLSIAFYFFIRFQNKSISNLMKNFNINTLDFNPKFPCSSFKCFSKYSKHKSPDTHHSVNKLSMNVYKDYVRSQTPNGKYAQSKSLLNNYRTPIREPYANSFNNNISTHPEKLISAEEEYITASIKKKLMNKPPMKPQYNDLLRHHTARQSSNQQNINNTSEMYNFYTPRDMNSLDQKQMRNINEDSQVYTSSVNNLRQLDRNQRLKQPTFSQGSHTHSFVRDTKNNISV